MVLVPFSTGDALDMVTFVVIADIMLVTFRYGDRGTDVRFELTANMVLVALSAGDALDIVKVVAIADMMLATFIDGDNRSSVPLGVI